MLGLKWRLLRLFLFCNQTILFYSCSVRATAQGSDAWRSMQGGMQNSNYCGEDVKMRTIYWSVFGINSWSIGNPSSIAIIGHVITPQGTLPRGTHRSRFN